MPLSPADRFAGLTPEQQEEALGLLKLSDEVGPDIRAAIDKAATVAEPDPEPAADLYDLGAFVDDTLTLRYAGRDYTLHAASVDLGLLVYRVWTSGVSQRAGRPDAQKRREAALELVDGVLDDDSHEALSIALLGGDPKRPEYRPERDVYDQLRKDGASWKLVLHMGTAAFLWAAEGREAALSFWHAGQASPKAPSAPAPRRPDDHRTPTAGTGRTTRTRASASGTKTPRKSATAGGKSGRTGE